MIRKLLSQSYKMGMNKQVPKNNFCIYQAYLNPEKHIFTGHNVNNVYEDIVLLGDNLLPQQLNEKTLSQTYIPQILDVTVSHLNSKYNLKLSANNYVDFYDQHWSELGIDIEAEKQEILDKLSKNIFIKDHKLRWPVEQRIRLQHTSEVFSYLDLNNYYVAYFFESYNTLLQNSIERSHLWQDKNIRGDASFQEKYNNDHAELPTGVNSLNEMNSGNENFINRFMKFIHKF